MRTLKDMLDVPLEDLRNGIKQWVDYSCKFWDDWLTEYNIQKAVKAGDEEEPEKTTEDKPEEHKIPDDLAAVIEYNIAIVEKYQSTGAESLLKHLVGQLAKERGIKDLDKKVDSNSEQTVGELLFEELKVALEVSPEKRELLKLSKAERVEAVVEKIIYEETDLVNKIKDGDKEIIKELDKKAIEAACGTVDENDLKFALRSMIKIELMKDVKLDA